MDMPDACELKVLDPVVGLFLAPAVRHVLAVGDVPRLVEQGLQCDEAVRACLVDDLESSTSVFLEAARRRSMVAARCCRVAAARRHWELLENLFGHFLHFLFLVRQLPTESLDFFPERARPDLQ